MKTQVVVSSVGSCESSPVNAHPMCSRDQDMCNTTKQKDKAMKGTCFDGQWWK